MVPVRWGNFAGVTGSTVDQGALQQLLMNCSIDGRKEVLLVDQQGAVGWFHP